MVMNRIVPSEDVWSTADSAGTTSTWLFDGQDGLDRLSGPADYSAAAPDAFRARLVRVQIDHIAVEGLAASQHTSTRTAEHIRSDPSPALTFGSVRAGRVRIELAESSFEVGPGELFVVDSRDPVAITAPTDVRILLSRIGLHHIPAHLQGRGTTIAAALPRTALIDSFVAFEVTILASTTSGRPVQGEQLIRAMADLHSAVLAEAQHLTDEPTGTAGMRHRMEEYIDAHLADRSLSPESLASAMGISLRHAHNVFNDGDRTIGRSIRDRRIEAVAMTLRTQRDRIALEELAVRHGFTSSETLGRSFRERFGMSVGEYRAGGHRLR